jgi:uncharacterized protein (DUF2249 family)/hemerythrin-like domain-containing protein
MSDAIETIQRHHAEILARLGEQVRLLLERRPEADPSVLADLLTHELLPHAAGEERFLYPAVEPLIKAHGHATATMRLDHQVIADYVAAVIQAAQEVAAADPSARAEVLDRVTRLALQLEAVLRLHLRKEEEVYLPLFARYLSPEEQQRVLDGMHAVQPHDVPPAAPVLDVRPLPPAQRHERIFQTYAALPPGAAFVLINDHDPKPLHYQFMYEYPGQFTWEYEERGPTVWRVRIGKAVAAP